MGTLLFLAAFLAIYVLSVKASVRLAGNLSLLWKHAALLSLVFAATATSIELGLTLAGISVQYLSALLQLPLLAWFGAWFLRGRLLTTAGVPATLGARIAITFAPVLVIAALGVAAAIFGLRS